MTLESAVAVGIRPASSADLDACAALDHSTSTEFVWQMELAEQDGSRNVSFRTVRLPRTMRVRYPRSGPALRQSWDTDACFLVAERGREVLGYVNARGREADATAWVADLVVHPDRRRQGIGTRLLVRARAWAHERELRRLIVETATKNHPAISFLQKNGLVFCGYNDLHYENRDIAVFFGQSL